MTLLSALMSTESQFSEILPYGNIIALEPIDLSKFCKKNGIYSWLLKYMLNKAVCFQGCGEDSFHIVLLASEKLHFPLR